ncbi:MAG: hypothetical protein IKO60_07305, partial [Bacteroidaceae bacterium]|nr:hypothetical protein [Bacteroidaceae bacterium]
MKPTSFQTTPHQHYSKILLVLTSDEAIEKGIIAERKVYQLMSFILLCWMNDWIRSWIWPNPKGDIGEKQMLILIGWLYDKGLVFEGGCYGTTIAKLLIEKNVLTSVKSVKSIKNYFSSLTKMSPIVQ